MRTVVLTCILVLVVTFSVTPPASAAGARYVVNINGRWGRDQIGVTVPSDPLWAHNAVIRAMETWNSAQSWFAKEYFPGGHVYDFVGSDQGPVRVKFNNVTWAPLPGRFGTSTIGSPLFDSATVDLSLLLTSREQLSPSVIYKQALHQLGHVLGMSHAVLSGDLMSDHTSIEDISSYPEQPSTLDLYAVHVLAELPQSKATKNPDFIQLPETIPYMTASVSVPEMPSLLTSVIVVILTVLILTKRRRAFFLKRQSVVS